uniref:ATP synthase subunit 8 n=1 Tax=Vollenhovia yambaru TaxID=629181 RepID=E5RQ23_9HYME|nr:ATP synthase subunit 8 [Vollenhovia yambaru]
MMPMYWLHMMIILLTFFLMTNIFLYFFTWSFAPSPLSFSGKISTTKWTWKW